MPKKGPGVLASFEVLEISEKAGGTDMVTDNRLVSILVILLIRMK